MINRQIRYANYEFFSNFPQTVIRISNVLTSDLMYKVNNLYSVLQKILTSAKIADHSISQAFPI